MSAVRAPGAAPSEAAVAAILESGPGRLGLSRDALEALGEPLAPGEDPVRPWSPRKSLLAPIGWPGVCVRVPGWRVTTPWLVHLDTDLCIPGAKAVYPLCFSDQPPKRRSDGPRTLRFPLPPLWASLVAGEGPGDVLMRRVVVQSGLGPAVTPPLSLLIPNRPV